MSKAATASQMRSLAAAMFKVCELMGIPATNDLGVILVEMHDQGHITDKELRKAHGILQRR